MSLANRLEKCYTGAVYDVMDELGRPDCTLSPHFRPLEMNQRLAGPAFTVAGRRDDTLDAHETLLQWTGLLSKAPADSVVVIQPNDDELAFMGELSAETLHFRGVRGVMIDGGCRDSNFIERIGFRVFCRHFTPKDIVGRWVPDAFDEPIAIDNVTIRAGDYVLGDRDGIVVIPAEMVEEVTIRAEKVLRTESLVRKAVLKGEDPQQAYIQYGKF